MYKSVCIIPMLVFLTACPTASLNDNYIPCVGLSYPIAQYSRLNCMDGSLYIPGYKKQKKPLRYTPKPDSTSTTEIKGYHYKESSLGTPPIRCSLALTDKGCDKMAMKFLERKRKIAEAGNEGMKYIESTNTTPPIRCVPTITLEECNSLALKQN